MVDEMDAAVSKLLELHRRLIGCFTSPTGIALPRRPRLLEPTMTDCGAALVGIIELERAKANIETLKAENDRLSKAVFSGVLGDLLTDDESEALVQFVKALRNEPASPSHPHPHARDMIA